MHQHILCGAGFYRQYYTANGGKVGCKKGQPGVLPPYMSIDPCKKAPAWFIPTKPLARPKEEEGQANAKHHVDKEVLL